MTPFDPVPVVEHRDGYSVVRDDVIPGGTKRRAIGVLFDGADEYVYASPAYGYAQVALAYAARDAGVQATIFVAKRKALHPRTAEAHAAGARVIQVPYGYLTNVQSKAKDYCAATGAVMLPWGLDDERVVMTLASIASRLDDDYPEVWCCAGSGVLTRALQIAFPSADHHAVMVGSVPKVGRATLHRAPERFEQRAKHPPPFPSCDNYDAKVWQFFRDQAAPDALFWNVAA